MHDGESAYFINHLKSMITMTLWIAFAHFFKKRSLAAINKVFPNGGHASIGGKQQRNIHTLGNYLMNNVFNKYPILDDDILGLAFSSRATGCRTKLVQQCFFTFFPNKAIIKNTFWWYHEIHC